MEKYDKKMNKFNYDKKFDIFAVHKGFAKDEKFKGNIDIGNIILDMSTKGKVKGIEILDAHIFLKNFKITKNILENLKEANFQAKTQNNSIMIHLILKSETGQELPASIAIPIETPRIA